MVGAWFAGISTQVSVQRAAALPCTFSPSTAAVALTLTLLPRLVAPSYQLPSAFFVTVTVWETEILMGSEPRGTSSRWTDAPIAASA